MEKAFDVKALAKMLGDRGLPVAETAAEQLWDGVKEWLVKSGEIKGGIAQGIISVAVPAVDGFVKESIDKIDGLPG